MPQHTQIATMVASMFLVWGGAAAQTIDWTHAYARRFGSGVGSHSDFRRGVAVMSDGTVATTGLFRGTLGGQGSSRQKTYSSFLSSTNQVLWQPLFAEINSEKGDVVPYGIAVADWLGDQGHTAFSVGSFNTDSAQEKVRFYHANNPNYEFASTSATKDAWVVRMSDYTQQVNWVARFTGAGDQEALAVAVGPPCATENGQAGESVRYYQCVYDTNFVAVGGYFTNQITFPVFGSKPSVGGEDAFLVLLDVIDGVPLQDFGSQNFLGLTLGSTGNDRITGVAVDPVDQSITVVGYFSGTGIDFDPDPGNVVGPNTYLGGTDQFVAKYKIAYQGQMPYLDFVWRCTSGTVGNDRWSAVALDSRGDAYGTGWNQPTQGNRDLVVAKLLPVCPTGVGTLMDPGPGLPANWRYTYTGSGDDAGLGIAVDGLDRVLVTGQFKGPTDFDPRVNLTDTRNSNGDFDIFVTRLGPDGEYFGTFTIGKAQSDAGAAIAVDPIRTQRIAHAGWFSAANVDFDPNQGVANLSSQGQTDAYVSSLKQTIPSDIKSQTSLVIDISGSVSDDEYLVMMDAYESLLTDLAVVPNNSKAAFNAVFHSTETPFGAVNVMPWTVFNADTAALFARRLAGLARFSAPPGSTLIDDGVEIAAATHIDAATLLPLDACYHSLHAIGDGENRYAGDPEPFFLQQARNIAIASSFVDKINGYAVLPPAQDNDDIDRDYLLTYLVAADNPAGTGFALQTPTDDGYFDGKFFDLLSRYLSRGAFCPGDYDRDGTVEPEDLTKFGSDSQSGANGGVGFDYADWNFDGTFDGHIPNGADRIMFLADHAAGCCP